MNALSLGELEHAIMTYIWGRGQTVTVPEVHAHLTQTRKLAYTTTMTVMSRLAEKELLGRREERRPYTYWAAAKPEDYSAGLMLGVLEEVGDRAATLARFVERIGEGEAQLLAELVGEARRRRRR
ncbi:MAG: BlaI/MecI/CopY family transcriptional regulator [Actinomycetota bacterium]